MPTVTVIQPTITEEKAVKIRCVAYCRVSSDSEDQLNSFMAQTRYYSQIFENSETEILIDIYADEGITGTREDKRDEFQRMMKDCRKGKIDRIYTKSISRFARNTRDCLKNIRELKSLGITICFEKECIDTANMTDEMMITIMGGLAQEESTSISQNMKWANRKRMMEGRYKISRPPYGFDLCDGQLKINPQEAKIVKLIFQKYLNGMGITSICNELNELKISSRPKWYNFNVKYILTNERYIGRALFQKKYKTDAIPSRLVKNNGELDQYVVENANPKIISENDFNIVQQLLKERGSCIKTKCTPYPLSGKIVCGNCRSTFTMKVSSGKRYWVCRNHFKRALNCNIKLIAEAKFYNAFITLCNKLLYNYKQILLPFQATLQDLKLKKFIGKTQVMDIHKEIATLREQNHVLARLKTKGFLDNAKYLEQTTELTAKINKLQAELKKLTLSDDEDETLEQIEMLTDYFEKRENSITEFDESAFENIVEKIVVINQNELEFHVIGGLKFTEKI